MPSFEFMAAPKILVPPISIVITYFLAKAYPYKSLVYYCRDDVKN